MAKCQCMLECKKQALPGSAFCAYHQQGCPRVSPVNGYEPLYEPDRYNKFTAQQINHNCYAYAFDVNENLDALCKAQAQQSKGQRSGEGCSLRFHQPGYRAGFKRFGKVKKIQCPDILSRIFGDVSGVTVTNFESKCPIGTSKIGLVIDNKRDYHFYRQDRGGMWSHKPGSGKVTNKDSEGNLIYDPALAARDYSKKNGKLTGDNLNYRHFCSYMCVPRGSGKNTLKRGGRRKTKGRRRTVRQTS